MRTYLDTSVLVPAILGVHEDHEEAVAAVLALRAAGTRGITSTHALAETWSVTTALPLRPRVEGGAALEAIRGLVETSLEVVPLGPEDYFSALEAVSGLGLRRGSVYDALHVRIARRSGADLILTYDLGDFLRVAPDLADRIRRP